MPMSLSQEYLDTHVQRSTFIIAVCQSCSLQTLFKCKYFRCGYIKKKKNICKTRLYACLVFLLCLVQPRSQSNHLLNPRDKRKHKALGRQKQIKLQSPQPPLPFHTTFGWFQVSTSNFPHPLNTAVDCHQKGFTKLCRGTNCQLNLSSLRVLSESQPVWLALRQSAFTCF